MLTLQDCIDYCAENYDLTEDEIEAIAAHEHIPEMVAAELADFLLAGVDGVPRIRAVIVEEIERAKACGNRGREARLMLALRHFVETHPEGGRLP